MLKEFYWRCAGVDPAEVQHWELKLRRKYSIFGWFVVMSGVVAAISGFLAFLTVFKSIIGSIVFATFFGLIVFNLYRFIVVNIGYRLGLGKNKREQFISTLPRVFMALILGFVISKPLELTFFSPIISQKSVEYSEKLYQKQVELIDIKFSDIVADQAERDTLLAEIEQKKLMVNEFAKQLQDTSATTNETVLLQLQRRYAQLQSEYSQLLARNSKQVQELEETIAKRTKLKEAELARSKETVQASFSLLNQLTVLHEYVPNTWLFTTVVVLFYVLPILGKIKFSNDDYALVYYLNERGERLGNRFKAAHIRKAKQNQAPPTQEEVMVEKIDTVEGNETPQQPKPYKEKPKLALARTSMLVVGLIILIGQLNQRNIFTDMLSVMLVLTAVLGWMKIVERELAAIAMVFFTIIGSFAIFMFHTGHPVLGVILGVIILLTFGILLIGSILPIMRFLYTVGLFLFLVMAIAFTINSMIRGDITTNNTEQQSIDPNLEHSDSVRVQVDSATVDLLMSHLRHWEDFRYREYEGKLEVWEKHYEEARAHKADYTYGSYKTPAEFWGRLYHYLSAHDGPELDRITQMFDSIRVTQSLNSMQFAEAIVTCIQDIPYTLISDVSCEKLKEDPKYAKLFEKYGCVEQEYGLQSPTEFMYNLKADCDTRTLTLYTLLSKLGYKVAILNSDRYEHSMLGVALPAHGKYVEHQGYKYYVWETTSKGWQIGSLPPKNNNMAHWKVVLANK